MNGALGPLVLSEFASELLCLSEEIGVLLCVVRRVSVVVGDCSDGIELEEVDHAPHDLGRDILCSGASGGSVVSSGSASSCGAGCSFSGGKYFARICSSASPFTGFDR